MAFGKTVLTTPEGAGSIPQRHRQMVVSPLAGFADRLVGLLAARPAAAAGGFPAGGPGRARPGGGPGRGAGTWRGQPCPLASTDESRRAVHRITHPRSADQPTA